MLYQTTLQTVKLYLLLIVHGPYQQVFSTYALFVWEQEALVRETTVPEAVVAL